ncbi:MAG: hypothetical protein ACREMA_06620, partial [Longimicrobiales bacterium]
MRSVSMKRAVPPIAFILAVLPQASSGRSTLPVSIMRADTGRFVIAPEGTEARYRVREQLA